MENFEFRYTVNQFLVVPEIGVVEHVSDVSNEGELFQKNSILSEGIESRTQIFGEENLITGGKIL